MKKINNGVSRKGSLHIIDAQKPQTQLDDGRIVYGENLVD